MKSKPISMKKLYRWGADFVYSEWGKAPKAVWEAQVKSKELSAILDRFLRYVWEHRND